MNINYLASLIAVIVLFLLVYVGVEAAGLRYFFGVLLPYLAVIIFIIGFVKKIVGWAKTPVPFRIPTTCGQQETLSWIKPAKIDNPTTGSGVFVRMLLEILCFRSLFRNTKMELREGDKLSYEWEKWLWLFALAFHYSFLTVLLRHLRFFLEPVPGCVKFLESIDGFLQIGLPGIMISGIILLAALLFLLLRRILIPQIKYISLASDYFPLFLIIGIAITGILMRYFTRVDIAGIKELTIGLVTFHPTVPDGGIGGLFYVHLFFVSVLIAYFPFSKLMHLGGIFMSPTRNLTTDTRATRHINPWNYDVKVHTYEEYEEEFREKMIGAGLPVEKES
ncbi:MAG: sulfate reduction electron transfer complex DsrMKJOP subunit DsrM [Deltaproteobacteria bacterium]|nr:sulfate reduction electron transfer complex DsrMKJOP subunit DsrM [Deltaproteobacteria bacterium]